MNEVPTLTTTIVMPCHQRTMVVECNTHIHKTCFVCRLLFNKNDLLFYDLFSIFFIVWIIIHVYVQIVDSKYWSAKMAATVIKPPNSTYTFSSQPKAVQQQGPRSKYRQAPINQSYDG